MGVKWLLLWRSSGAPVAAAAAAADGGAAAGVAGLGDEGVLTSMVEQLGCKPLRDKAAGKMEVKCHLLRQQGASTTQGQCMRDLWLVQSSDATDACALVDRSHHAVLEADNGMLTLVEKKLAYRIKTCVTVTGKCYSKGDFGVRVASASASMVGAAGGVALLGHTLEVEYLPLSCPVLAGPMLAQFVELLRAHIPLHPVKGQPMGSLDRARDSLEKSQALPATFSHLHSAVLYVDLTMTFLVQKQQQQQLQQGQTAQAAAGRAAAAATPG